MNKSSYSMFDKLTIEHDQMQGERHFAVWAWKDGKKLRVIDRFEKIEYATQSYPDAEVLP